MKKREKQLLAMTIFAAVCALGYIFVFEPLIKQTALSDSVKTRNRKYLGLLARKDDIEKRFKAIDANYFKPSPQEQQLVFQVFMEKLAKQSGISRIKSIVPEPLRDGGGKSEEISLQMDLECALSALTKLLYETGNSGVPLRVRKLQLTGETGEPNTVRAQILITSLWINPS
jgi:hypothetical protein